MTHIYFLKEKKLFDLCESENDVFYKLHGSGGVEDTYASTHYVLVYETGKLPNNCSNQTHDPCEMS